MNFENYNKIYQEILDDENNELSANYLLNKYQIKHDEELINILNQIKKNEYISSDNMVINRLLEELDEDENLLDINEIIDIKEKVITEDISEEETTLDNFIKEENKKEEKKPQEETNKKSDNKINNISKNLNIKYIVIILITMIFFIIILFISKSNKIEDKEIQKAAINNIETMKESKSIENEQEKDKESIETKEKIESKTETIQEEMPNDDKIIENKEEISNDKNQTTENNNIEENSLEKKLDNIDAYDKNEQKRVHKIIEVQTAKENEDKTVLSEGINSIENSSNESPTLASLEDIEKYKNQLIYQDGKLIFNNQSYKEEENLFGFKIYKLTPLYVKFEDESRHMRKRILLKK